MVSEILFQSWYVTGAVLLAVYLLADFLYTGYLLNKFGAKRIQFGDNDYLLGFRLAATLLKKKAKGEMIDYTGDRFMVFPEVKTVQMRMAGVPVISTIDPENIKAILATQFNDFSLGTRHAQFDPVLGDGIFTLDKEGWKHSRQMLRPQFAREQVAHVKALEPHVQVLAKHVRNAAGGKFDLQELFFRLTMDSATEFLFGESVESLRDASVGYSQKSDIPGKFEFAEAFNSAQGYLATRAVLQDLFFIIRGGKFARDTKIVHTLTDYYVQKTLDLSQSELEKVSADDYTFLYELAKQTRDPRVLRDQALNILLAGRDTTAGLLSFTFFELARNPAIFKRLREEIEQHFGLGDESRIEEITFESLKKCEYLKAVINESLRMYPSVPINFRTCTRNTTLPRGGGPKGEDPILVRKGQNVTYAVSITHKHPDYYGKDSEVYDPERWFQPESRKLGWAYVPFNGGPRICLGQQFALTEASYVVARLLQMFSSIESFDQEYPPKKMSQLTMSLFNGCNVSLA
ncbi:cytochrome P450 52A12 [Diutina catenulata]